MGIDVALSIYVLQVEEALAKYRPTSVTFNHDGVVASVENIDKAMPRMDYNHFGYSSNTVLHLSINDGGTNFFFALDYINYAS